MNKQPRPSLALFWPLSRRAARFLGRFARARRGATAVEFAMIATPFLALLFASFELGMIFLVSTTLTASAADAARTIRTGQFQAGGFSAQTFKDNICNNLGWLQADCESNVYIDVRTYPQFAAMATPTPITNGALDPSQLRFQPGNACDIVMARAFYVWPLITPGLTQIPQLNGGKVLLTASQAFRNEPFGGATC
jgi:Flp pilus assembly protein TadG